MTMATETATNVVAPLPIVQTEADNILWLQLVTELSRQYEGQLKVVFPTQLDEHTYSWFRAIEEHNFRPELRYTFDELKSVLGKPGLFFLFVFKGEVPEIVVLGYTCSCEVERTFRLDTFAINKHGKGIGHIVMNFLIKWARAKQYVAIVLDTEETDEKGIHLQHFYEKHKFVVVAREPTGDITMRCSLVETSSTPPAGPPLAALPQVETPPASAPSASPPPASPPPSNMPPVDSAPANTSATNTASIRAQPVNTPTLAAPLVPTILPLVSRPPAPTALGVTMAPLIIAPPEPTTAPAKTTLAATRPTDTQDSPAT